MRDLEIIATMGPACFDEKTIEDLIKEGVTSFRFPFSKETPEIHINNACSVKEVGHKLGFNIETIMDLPGGKARVINKVTTHINEGQDYFFSNQNKLKSFFISNINDFRSVCEGDTIIIGDGELAFTVKDVKRNIIKAGAVNSGDLLINRGFYILGRNLYNNNLTQTDKLSITCCNHSIFDSVLISFVESKSDIERLKIFIESNENCLSDDYRIIPKIETIEAVCNLETISQGLDAVLIGRGDLLMSTGVEKFYERQIYAINKAKEIKKKVYIGTQLLESLSSSLIPYRAELSDVSNLLNYNINGVLLSSEVSVSPHPLRAVKLLKELYNSKGYVV